MRESFDRTTMLVSKKHGKSALIPVSSFSIIVIHQDFVLKVICVHATKNNQQSFQDKIKKNLELLHTATRLSASQHLCAVIFLSHETKTWVFILCRVSLSYFKCEVMMCCVDRK